MTRQQVCEIIGNRVVIFYTCKRQKKSPVTGLEISARPLANASINPVGQVEISGYSPGLASRIFIFRKHSESFKNLAHTRKLSAS